MLQSPQLQIPERGSGPVQIVIVAEQEEDLVAHAIAHLVEPFADISDIWLFPDDDGMELASCEEFMTRPLLLVACPPRHEISLLSDVNAPVHFFNGRDPEVTVLLHFKPTAGNEPFTFTLPWINRKGTVHEVEVEPDATPESIAQSVFELFRPALT